VLVERASAGGRDINGMICPLPDGTGRFIGGKIPGSPTSRGGGIFAADGDRGRKLAATYFVVPGDPFGCGAFDSQGGSSPPRSAATISGDLNGPADHVVSALRRLPGAPGTFPNAERSKNFCKIASNLGTATSIAIDEQDRVYVVSARGTTLPSPAGVVRFSPPFPTGPDAAARCGRVDATRLPHWPITVDEQVFINDPAKRSDARPASPAPANGKLVRQQRVDRRHQPSTPRTACSSAACWRRRRPPPADRQRQPRRASPSIATATCTSPICS
jgi:hypothetical protein